MRLITKKLPADHNLFLFGDVHTGSLMMYQKGWDLLVEMMRSPFDGVPSSGNFGIDHGDVLEGIMIDDKRYDFETVRGRPTSQIKEVIRLRRPIADKLITILDGNHPAHLKRYGNITREICEELDVPYGTWTCKISVVSGYRRNLIYKHFCTHGRKTITSTADDPKRRRANMELILKRNLKFKAGDCALMSMGHTHKLLVCEPDSELYLVDNGVDIKQRYTKAGQTEDYIHPDHRWFINTGSFLRLYADDVVDNVVSGYAEQFAYDPVELGFVVVKVRDCKIEGVEKVII